MGTGPLGLPTLEKLNSSESHNLVAIITQPDRPAGRGMQLRPSVVKQFAHQNSIPCDQPELIRADVDAVARHRPDLVVVAAYGQILTREIIDVPSMGTINIHASLLPKYRGAAPIQWAIMNGESETGISTFFIEEGLDTGDVLLKRAIPITEDDTAGSLHDKLANLGADVLMEALDGLNKGTLTATPQDHSRATYAPKITNEMARIDWTKSASEICNVIRGLNPVPGAFTFLNERRLKIHFARTLSSNSENANVGEITGISDEGIVTQTGSGEVLLTELQPEGKSKMPAQDFVRGHQINVGLIFD